MTEPIQNNSKLLYLQAKNQFEQAKLKFEDGSIKTETKLIQNVFKAFEDFFVSIGKPQMILRLAPESGPPWSADYNNMMNEIKVDLELMYQEIDILGRALYTDFNHNMVQHSIIQSEFDIVADKLKDLQLLSSNLATNGRIVFKRNDFVNKDGVDYDRIANSPAQIENGVVTLAQTSKKNVSEGAEITIIPGNTIYENYIIGSESNGFPGNNHEVTVIPGNTTGSDYLYQYVGAKNNYGSYGAVLDGNAETWFEFESVNVRDHDRQQIGKNLGFDYQVNGNQKLNWARDPADGILKLHMQIILAEASYINTIDISMYTPANYGAKTAIVKNILVSDGSGISQSIISANKKDEDYIFHFKPIMAKVVSIIFHQANKYYTDIGHQYYEQTQKTTSDTDYAFNTVTKKAIGNVLPRVDGPNIALQDIGIGVQVNDTSVRAYYPLQTSGQSGVPIEDVVASLSNGITKQTVDTGTERFEGWRYMIGIRSIDIYSCEYEKTGEVITDAYYFDQPLEKITLSVNEDTPLITEAGNNFKWIKYFVSIDDGANWYPISPIEHQEYESGGEATPPKIYTVQQVEKALSAVHKPNYIESEYPVYSIRLKILFERPDGE